MSYLFGRGLIFSAILMFGFILGIVYSNHVQEESDSIFAKKESASSEVEKSFSTVKPSPIVFREVESNKIKMEDGEGLVIYGHEDEEIKKQLIQDVDLQRDLIDKNMQVQANKGHNFFSQMGIRTAEAFEGVTRNLFSMVSY
ncbi:MAG: hypothetical protein LRY73_20355 [Bacillus sp. (in: Bacteria)]|nr:hypothetical protein [Bacillus sp. (in: firmicutes)]